MDRLTVKVPSYIENETASLSDGLEVKDRLSQAFTHYFQSDLFCTCSSEDQFHYVQLFKELSYMLDSAIKQQAGASKQADGSKLVIPPPVSQTVTQPKPRPVKIVIPESLRLMTEDIELGLAYKRTLNEMFLGFFESNRFKEVGDPETYTGLSEEVNYLFDQCINEQTKGGECS